MKWIWIGRIKAGLCVVDIPKRRQRRMFGRRAALGSNLHTTERKKRSNLHTTERKKDKAMYSRMQHQLSKLVCVCLNVVAYCLGAARETLGNKGMDCFAAACESECEEELEYLETTLLAIPLDFMLICGENRYHWIYINIYLTRLIFWAVESDDLCRKRT